MTRGWRLAAHGMALVLLHMESRGLGKMEQKPEAQDASFRPAGPPQGSLTHEMPGR